MKIFVEDIFGLQTELQGDISKLDGVMQVLIELTKASKSKERFCYFRCYTKSIAGNWELPLKDEKNGNISYSFN